jgi:chorismate synthase
MNRIRFFTAGESHGQALTAILDGIPAGLDISQADIQAQLKRRQRGYGRGGRMQIECDQARILSGVRYGKSLGSPIALLIENKDWANWTSKMSVTPVAEPAEPLHLPRPGHADYAGMIKYHQNDLRNILERSSARETAARVAIGTIAKLMLAEFDIQIFGYVTKIGGIQCSQSALEKIHDTFQKCSAKSLTGLVDKIESSPLACADEEASAHMMALIDSMKEKGDTLGGQFEVIATHVPVGLGSHVQWDRKLSTRIMATLGSINAMKAVEIGMGTGVADRPGSEVHDELFYRDDKKFFRKTNHAGGIEGGMSNGEPIVVRLSMKPLPTLSQPLQSVDAATHEAKQAFSERSDVCAVPAAVVVAEAMLALVLADAVCEKLGGDSIAEMKRNFQGLARVPLE